MARLIDLDAVAEAGGEAEAGDRSVDKHQQNDNDDGRANPNVGRFSAALACYP